MVLALAFCRTILRKDEAAISAHVYLRANDVSLDVAAHGGKACKESFLGAKVFESGDTTVPLESLYQIVSGAAKGQSINLVVKDRAIVTWPGSRYTLPTLPIADFPPLLTAPKDNPITLNATEVKDLFERPATMLLADQSILLYSGVWLHPRNGLIASFGSDGTRLLCAGVGHSFLGRPEIMVGREACAELARMGAGEFWWDKATLCAQSGNNRYATRLLNTGYADYSSVVPSVERPYLEFDHKELSSALGRLGSLATHGSIVKLHWTKNPKTATFEFVRQGDGQEIVKCSGNIEAGKIGLPPIRCGELLNQFSGGRVRFHIESSFKPFRIFALNDPETICAQSPCHV